MDKGKDESWLQSQSHCCDPHGLLASVWTMHTNLNQITTPLMDFLPLPEPPTHTTSPAGPESPIFCLSQHRPPAPPTPPRLTQAPLPGHLAGSRLGLPSIFRYRAVSVLRCAARFFTSFESSAWIVCGRGWEWVSTCRRQLTCLSSLLFPSSGRFHGLSSVGAPKTQWF